MSNVPLNDLKRIVTDFGDDVMASASEALRSGWWLNGTRTKAFCEAFGNYVGAAHCIGVANGTDALEIAFRALLAVRAPKGREVVTVANAGGYSAVAARLAGLTPVYADIEEASQLVSIDSVLSCVSEQTACIVVTHLYGGAVNVPLLRERLDAAGHSDVALVEDCAQAHGARVGGRRVGSLGTIATFSFYPTKNLGAFGDAGCVVTSDPDIALAVDRLRQYGWTAKYEIEHPFGRNSRMDEVQAAILMALLPSLEAANERRVAILDRYAEAASETVRLVRPAGNTVAHLAIVLAEDREGLRRAMTDAGVATDIHYPILDVDQPAWKNLPFREAPGGLVVCRASLPRLLTLPCFPTMREDEIGSVCRVLSAWR